MQISGVDQHAAFAFEHLIDSNQHAIVLVESKKSNAKKRFLKYKINTQKESAFENN